MWKTFAIIKMSYELIANITAALHIAWVLSVAVCFLWTIASFLVHRRFLDWFWIRTVHLMAVIIIALPTRFGMTCPLSFVEFYLRTHSDSGFAEGFVLHYLRKFIHEGIGMAFVEMATLILLLGTLAAYLYRPPKRVSNINWPGKRKTGILVERRESAP